ncbi:hypothetical protein L0B53_02865 [Vibrio sp. SS-MA-C1-2]|uniref:hypothetical protein n=1 Tax=Vibrio sp. SS-MA-C1-2 TaxID=2908646 RepID=UPI001F3CA9E2|nr:hypothetical protein [Vibrio sp. SS-MA-C1-2]UJF16900.1 hypothetical protein L0B53_02865 [Vibrio sp. SS-MA-C1-2]
MLRKSVLSVALVTFFTFTASSASATESSTLSTKQQCFADKYSQYVDASLTWYQDLVKIAVNHDSNLKQIGDAFYQGRVNHFTLNKEAVAYYLVNQPEKVNTNKSVESWLTLSQSQIKVLSEGDTPLTNLATKEFAYRQESEKNDNYALRTAFNELLTQPTVIQQPLDKYNHAMTEMNKISCK